MVNAVEFRFSPTMVTRFVVGLLKAKRVRPDWEVLTEMRTAPGWTYLNT